ncbi:redox-sensitive transcriptional activator SoxR [Pseudomonas syringae]|uniref:redox-sensitive transcriptional activator SoxR n=1 Tax=Pseudomonas syringae TaxID=317 RepID=UPI003F74EF08
MTKKLLPTQQMSVGEVAKRSGVPVSTLHFYETKGLLEPKRTAGNQRVYSRAVLRRIAIIRVAQSAGISLSEIKAALDPVPHDHVPTASEWASVSTHWSGDLRQRISQLQNLLNNLERCIGCGCLSQDYCPLRNAEDHLGQSASGSLLLGINDPDAELPQPGA